ncbi:hypothetical protein QE152_g21839 [Popillia japonica]|uniref:Uncharacterized protein n=1 Tax=Popillia japonica TaxID=7064 RepID=A0AAW1KN84_POPJA
MSDFNNKTTKQDGSIDTDDQATNTEDFERQLEEALIFGRRSSVARAPPSTPPPITIKEGADTAEIQTAMPGSRTAGRLVRRIEVSQQTPPVLQETVSLVTIDN